ncbi:MULTISPECIES: hypothetical protein [Flagellimonas]|uniref:Uncharacterized protein n=2 Tax=Flagellimonas TaxID=444459 RepID=A0A3A1NFY0_9FLAO|nr:MULTISPECIES: hypothetical protein [Allomuricauda]MBW8242793.1 hypothetical protein [Allomuricauda oceani]QII45472.1 hypothetical protein GVT53_12545 [Allomuricauda oceani]RIV42420.1 hypothetical protein D2V05_16615 [Allomuricauda maritima]TXJ91450.1 hypothetical protein FQ017_16475 [Allomuricauda maritima]
MSGTGRIDIVLATALAFLPWRCSILSVSTTLADHVNRLRTRFGHCNVAHFLSRPKTAIIMKNQ